MDSFVYSASSARVIFGSGTKVLLADEVRRLSCHRALVLSTPQQRKEANMSAADLGALPVGVFRGAVMHMPVEVNNCRPLPRNSARIACWASMAVRLQVAAIAFTTALPQIALPTTTYSGWQAASIIGETAAGKKMVRELAANTRHRQHDEHNHLAAMSPIPIPGESVQINCPV